MHVCDSDTIQPLMVGLSKADKQVGVHITEKCLLFAECQLLKVTWCTIGHVFVIMITPAVLPHTTK